MVQSSSLAVPSLPIRLERPPLVEAVIEIRFAGGERFVGDLLPGVIHEKLKGRFTGHEPTPIAYVPREVREGDPDFRYRAQVKLNGTAEALLLGDHVVALSKLPPYSGWTSFRDSTIPVLDVVRSSELVSGLERLSIKAVNLVTIGDRHPTAVLNGEISLGGVSIRRDGLRLRAETEEGGFTSIVEVASMAKTQVGDTVRSGVLVSVDTMRETTDSDFWTSPARFLDDAHDVMKRLFFKVVHPDIISECGPIFEVTT